MTKLVCEKCFINTPLKGNLCESHKNECTQLKLKNDKELLKLFPNAPHMVQETIQQGSSYKIRLKDKTVVSLEEFIKLNNGTN